MAGVNPAYEKPLEGQVPRMHFAPALKAADAEYVPLPDKMAGKTLAERAEERFSLKGKRAIVTGGGQGLGLVAAGALLDHGVSHLAILEIEADKETACLTHLKARGSDATIIFKQVDVTDAAAIGSVVHEVAEAFGGIEVLLTFAGIVYCEPALDYKPEGFRKVIDVNTTGGFLTAQAVAKEMISRKTGGSIVLTASMSGHIVNFPQVHAAYNVSKSGVHGLTRCLAAEWAVYGIRVNSISPGYMDTRLNAGDILVEARGEWYRRTPMGRMGDPEDLTGAIVMLCSRAGAFMTGSDVVIDGGYTCF